MPVQRVPHGDHAETDQPERHRPFHGAACPIAGLTHTHDLAGISEGLLNSPPRRITGHQVFRRGFQIGGHQRKPITAMVTIAGTRLIVANQNDPHGTAAKRSIPQADPFGDLHGVGAPITTDPGGAPPRPGRSGGGQVGRGAQPGAAGAGPPGAPGAGRRQPCSTEVTFRRLVQVIRSSMPRRRSPT